MCRIIMNYQNVHRKFKSKISEFPSLAMVSTSNLPLNNYYRVWLYRTLKNHAFTEYACYVTFCSIRKYCKYARHFTVLAKNVKY